MTETNGRSQNGSRGAFYRLCRTLHGYFSAVAFLALLFFAGTGILLNHPEWMPEREQAQPSQSLVLDTATRARAEAAGNRAASVLAQAISARATVRGAFTTGEILDGEALLRFEGARGNSNATVDMASGRVEIEVENAVALSVLNDLHRGKNAGAAWKLMIDIVGGLTIALSLIGFVIFFSMRFRLLTSLTLVGVGAAAMAAVFLLFVP